MLIIVEDDVATAGLLKRAAVVAHLETGEIQLVPSQQYPDTRAFRRLLLQDKASITLVVIDVHVSLDARAHAADCYGLSLCKDVLLSRSTCHVTLLSFLHREALENRPFAAVLDLVHKVSMLRMPVNVDELSYVFRREGIT